VGVDVRAVGKGIAASFYRKKNWFQFFVGIVVTQIKSKNMYGVKNLRTRQGTIVPAEHGEVFRPVKRWKSKADQDLGNFTTASLIQK